MKIIVGVMGPGSASPELMETAEALGGKIARQGWITLTGGRPAGVMEAALKGAKTAGGLTVGILPSDSRSHASKYVEVPIVTAMGSARNNINVLTSHVVVACGTGAGTASEVALAIKAGKPVVLLGNSQEAITFFQSLAPRQVKVAESANDVISQVKYLAEKYS